MAPLLDEHVQAVGDDVRELARLHGELARAEVREGSSSFVRGVVLCAFGVLTCALVMVALGVALYSLANRVLTPAGAAAAVAAIYAVVGGLALQHGIRLVGGVSSIFLPRTRTMLWELLTCRDKPTKS